MIKLKNISKKYKKEEVLSNINFEVNKGEMISIVGESGSGKSTLLNILGMIDTPTKGEYIFNDNIISQEKEMRKYRAKYIGFILQNYGLLGDLTVESNLKLSLNYAGIDKKEWTKLINDELEELNIKELKKKLVKNLSGGQKQRVAIARAVIKRPSVILADEPTGNLDNKNERIVMDLLTNLNNKGIAIILVTHNHKLADECNKKYELLDKQLNQVK